MKEIEFDKYVGKYVEVELTYAKDIRQGILYKITNGWWKRNGVDYQSIINKGYILECFDIFLTLRQSHIKKIREVKMQKTKLKVTENHIKLLKNLYIDWEDCEFGAPCVNCKRPFGNSDVYGDMAKILGIELADEEKNYELYKKQIESLGKGYRELQDCLQILCDNLSIEVGTYEFDIYKNTKWYKTENK